VPLAAFLAAFAGSHRVRGAVLAADLRTLTGAQAWRAGGLASATSRSG
jgi:hypothetical protein